MAKQRLCYLTGGLGGGGYEQQLYYLLNELQHREYKIDLIIWSYDTNEKNTAIFDKLNINIHRFNKNESYLKKLLLLRNVIKKCKPSIVHSYTFYLNFALWLCCLFTKTKPIGGLRSQYVREIETYGKTFSFLSGYFPKIYISNNYCGANELKQQFRNKKVYVITNKLDIARFTNNLPNSSMVTVSISSIRKEKCIDKLIEVIDLLKNKYNLPITHYHAGDGNATTRNKMEQLIKEKGLEETFILEGEIKDINNFLKKSTLLIHAAKHEGMPNVIMEAFSCGRAVVSTDCGDAAVLIKDDYNGYICKVNDVSALAEKSNYLLQNRDICLEMSKNARRYAEEHFDKAKLIDETLNIYNTILN